MKDTFLLSLTSFFDRFTSKGVLLLAIIASFTAWYIFYVNQLIMIYNDSMSHVNLSRLVVDNVTPGVAQLGGVWLPLTHVFPLLLIWNDWAWQSGFAASIFSMLAYIGSVWGIYKIVELLTGKKIAAVLGALAFGINLNILYLQATPLTEPTYIVFFVLSVWVFAKYLFTDKTKYITLLGILGFFQVLARYDGWFVVGIEALLLGIYEVFIRRRNFSEVIGKLTIFSFPVAFGVGLWLLWNLLIFNDPFFFAFGPYSAHAQQSHIENQATLITKHNLWISLKAYALVILANVGELITILSVVGMAVYLALFQRFRLNQKVKIIFLLFLASPIIFNILALFFGFSILNVPSLGWNPSPNPGGQWFNVRYGVLALPFGAVLIGVFAGWRKLAAIIAFEVIVLQAVLMYQAGAITITDGVIGSSSYRYHDSSDYLSKHVQPDDTILLSVSYFNPVAFRSGIQLSQVLHEGIGENWQKALNAPESYATWIIMANGKTGEPAYETLVLKQKERFFAYYDLAHKGEYANIYKRKVKTQ